MNEYIKIIIVASILILATWCKFRKYSFRYDEKDPSRRNCNRCGQRQAEVTDCTLKTSTKKWITLGKTIDKDCFCHDHVGIEEDY